MKKYRLILPMIVIMMTIGISGNAFALNPNWYQDVDGWHYYISTSQMAKDSWQNIGGNWYYFNGSSVMATGWVKVADKHYYLGTDGIMVNGHQIINGVHYYFNTNGSLLLNGLTPDQYQTDSNGAVISNRRVIAGVSIEAPSSFQICTSTQMSGWQGIVGELRNVGNSIFQATNKARRFHLYPDYISYAAVNGTSEKTLIELSKDYSNGGYNLDIRTPLNAAAVDLTKPEAYDYQVARMFCYEISAMADLLDLAIYDSWIGNNSFGIKRNEWVPIGDCQVMYESMNECGRYHIRPAG